MKKKLLFIFIGAVLITITILCIIKFIKSNNQKLSEITPLEELTEEQERQTMISLYFTNVDTNTLIPEARRIDSKKLLDNPYKVLVELLIEGPKNEKCISNIPEGTKVNGAVLQNNTVVLDMSKEFIDNSSEDREAVLLGIEAIVNTLTELNEVNAIKIVIDGEENKSYENMDISLEEIFTRKN